jgi:tetratricopeptide (TPR) repeat protein
MRAPKAFLGIALALAFATAAQGEAFHLFLDMVPANAPAELLKAKALYDQRDGTGKSAREMLAVLDPYLNAHPDDYNALMLASAAAFWIGDRSTDEKVKMEFGLKGYTLGEKMIALKPEQVAGHYFYTINLGNYGEGISIIKALSMGLDKNYRRHGEKALVLDPGFEGGGADRALGRFYFKLPWPKYSAEKSIAHLRHAIQLAPRKTRTYSYLADTLFKEKRYDEAEKTIRDGLAAEAYPWDTWEAGFYKGEMKKLLPQIEAAKK